jgi:predicted amidohydrolase YtcJ
MVEAARNGIRVGSFDPKILALYEQVNKRVAITEQRWIIEHVGIFDADEIARLRDLGVVLQAYSNRWIYQEGEQHRTSLGEARASRVLPMRALIDAGVHVSLATDNVPPTMFDPIWHVVARRPRGGDTVLAPDQRISRIEALAAASREGAWLSQEEAEKGTLEPGKLADIAIFDKDLLTVDEAEIPSIKADVTITGGRIVYQNQ